MSPLLHLSKNLRSQKIHTPGNARIYWLIITYLIRITTTNLKVMGEGHQRNRPTVVEAPWFREWPWKAVIWITEGIPTRLLHHICIIFHLYILKVKNLPAMDHRHHLFDETPPGVLSPCPIYNVLLLQVLIYNCFSISWQRCGQQIVLKFNFFLSFFHVLNLEVGRNFLLLKSLAVSLLLLSCSLCRLYLQL